MLVLSEICKEFKNGNKENWNIIYPALKENYYECFEMFAADEIADEFAKQWLSNPANTRGYNITVDNGNWDKAIYLKDQIKNYYEIELEIEKRYLADRDPFLEREFVNWVFKTLINEYEVYFTDDGKFIDSDLV